MAGKSRHCSVLFVDEFSHLGGAEIVLLQILQHCAAREIRPCCMVDENGPLADRIRALGIPVHTAEFQQLKQRWLRPFAWKTMHRQVTGALIRCAPTLIVANSPWAALAVNRSARRVGCPVLAAVHADIAPKSRAKKALLPLLRTRLTGTAAAWVTVSMDLKHQLTRLGVANDDITVIPNGVDLSLYHPDPSVRLRAQLGIPEEAVVLLTAGRLHPRKGQRDVLAAFHAQSAPDLHLVVAGEEICSEIEHLQFTRCLEQDAGAHGRAHRVHFLGFRDDMPDVFRAADIFILLSREESFGLAVLEAMASGLPCIVSDVGGLRQLVEEGVTGYRVALDHPDMVADRIRRLAADADLRREMGSRGTQAARIHGLDRTIDSWFHAFHRLIGFMGDAPRGVSCG